MRQYLVPKYPDARPPTNETLLWSCRLPIVSTKKECAVRSPTNSTFASRYAKLFVPAAVMLIVEVTACAPITAQTITVRLLNAKTGEAIGNKNVTVKWTNGAKSSEILLDNNGQGNFQIPTGSREFFMIGGPRFGNEPYRVAYIECNEPAMTAIQVAQVLEKGFAPHNNCGHQSLVSRPGEIIFWALPLPWWRPDFQ